VGPRSTLVVGGLGSLVVSAVTGWLLLRNSPRPTLRRRASRGPQAAPLPEVVR
jgi:hypothetical protein